ncbi:MAG: hypothetical protein IAE81_06375 [Caldilineaceae bacterium]|nr:hypothetical protein [Caldilineaceae bacterium]
MAVSVYSPRKLLRTVKVCVVMVLGCTVVSKVAMMGAATSTPTALVIGAWSLISKQNQSS